MKDRVRSILVAAILPAFTLAVLLALVAPAAADEIVVSPGESIQAAINGAIDGDTILIAAGTYTESLTLSKPVSLTGVSSGTTIVHAVPGQRVLTVTGSAISNSVIVAGLTFAGGDATEDGGGVLITGDAQPLIQDVTLRDNQVGDYGGGIYAADGSPLVLIDVACLDNTAGKYGGGACADDAATLTGCWFENNAGVWGTGGLYADDTLEVSGTTFISNAGSNEGCAVYVYDAATVVNCWFEGNESLGEWGGGLYVNGTLGMTGTTFISNTAQDGAGGAYVYESATVADCRFERNQCTYWSCDGGGGLYADGNLDMRDTTLVSNTTAGSGGGAYVDGEAAVVGGWFVNNQGDEYGGGLYVYSTLHITGTTVVSNAGQDGGGGVYAYDDAIVAGSWFERNKATHGSSSDGGGLYASTLHATGSTFISNTARRYGGGGKSWGGSSDPTTLVDCWFQNNESGYGGGLFENQALGMTGTTFVSNTATTYYGGGVYANALTAAGSAFISNTAADHGGGAYAYEAATATDSRFERNVSEGDGGGLYVSQRLVLGGTTLNGNRAEDGGGAYTSGPATVANSWFEDNESPGEYGGGLCAYGTLVMAGTTFIRNTAPSYGGGVYVDNAATVTSSRFEDNESLMDGGGLYAYSGLGVTGTTFISNTAAGRGGGLYRDSGSAGRLANVLLARNSAGDDGAAVFLGGSGVMEIIHATVADDGLNPGQAVYVMNAPVAITNTIIASYTIGVENDGGTVSEDYNLFFANTDHLSGTSIVTGAQSLSGPAADPKFLDPPADDYHLDLGSPAIDSGLALGIPTDLDGVPRLLGPDRGAYEVPHVCVPLVVRDV